MNLDHWIETYRRAWEARDPSRMDDLFARDATYRSSPFKPPHRGLDAIREYWARATASQSNVEVAMGTPVKEAGRVVVEWWALMDDEGSPLTLPGALILDFRADGRCGALREYYNILPGDRIPPHPGWGT